MAAASSAGVPIRPSSTLVISAVPVRWASSVSMDPR